MRQYLEEGARRGHSACMTDLAFHAIQSGNIDEAMQNLVLFYRPPFSAISKDDLATTLRAHKAANDTRKTVPREYLIRFKAFEEKMISTGKMKVVSGKDKRKYNRYVHRNTMNI